MSDIDIQGGFTLAEFEAIAKRRLPFSELPRDTSVFLRRCCQLGLLRSETRDGVVRYFPTDALRDVVGAWG